MTTVGILSAGDMGSAIGAMLTRVGVDAATVLEGRSPLSRTRAAEAGMRDVGSLDDLVRQSALILSVLVPSESKGIADAVAGAMGRTGARPVFAECNAIAPQTVEAIAKRIGGLGATFIDAGIIGSPPKPGGNTRICCSGPDVSAMSVLADAGLTVKTVGPEIGQASGLKMVYAASTKGTTALWTQLLTAARMLGLDGALFEELGTGSSGTADQLIGGVPAMPRRSRRWVGEMWEIAKTFERLGLSPDMLNGAAATFQLVGGTHLSAQTSREPDPSLEEVLTTLAAAASERAANPPSSSLTPATTPAISAEAGA